MRVQPNRSATYLRRAIGRINAAWPGGTEAMLADYAAGKVSLADVTEKTGVRFRALRRIFAQTGAKIRTVAEATRREHAWNPERRASASAVAKRVFRNPEIRAASYAARRAAHLVDPSKHVNFRAKMSKYESITAAALKDAGFAYEFNRPFPPFWVDFWLPDLAVGIEVQKPSRIPSRDRDAQIRAAGARTVFYFSTYHIGLDRIDDLIQVVLDVQCGRLDPASLGEYTMISRRPHNAAFLQIGPHKFRWPFGPMYAYNCPPPPPVGKDYITFPDLIDADSPAAS